MYPAYAPIILSVRHFFYPRETHFYFQAIFLALKKVTDVSKDKSSANAVMDPDIW